MSSNFASDLPYIASFNDLLHISIYNKDNNMSYEAIIGTTWGVYIVRIVLARWYMSS